MILPLLVYFISSQHIFDLSFEQAIFNENNESECSYDSIYTSTFISKTNICFIRCTFNSIKYTSNGGAIFIDHFFFFYTNNIIHNCTFMQCSAKSGGAFYFKELNDLNPNQESRGNCSIEVINSNFYENSAYANSGGSLYIFTTIIKSYLKIKNCTFDFNSAIKNGGSMFLQNIIYSIYNCTFNNNALKSDFESTKGSAIFIEVGESDDGVINCIFTNNTAINNYNLSYGGAICISNDKKEIIEICQCTFTNNSVVSFDYESFGGAILFKNKKENYFLNECIFVNNTSYSSKSSTFGGAASFINYREFINITLIKCFFYNNAACSLNGCSYGGAILSHNFFALLNICEFKNNTANSNTTSKGGSVYIKIQNDSQKIHFSQSCLFDNLTFINNSVYSNSSSYGGSISYDTIGCSYMQQTFKNCSFINNKVFSNYSSHGGAIESKSDMDAYFRNCIFVDNYAEVYLNKKYNDINGGSLGGAIYLEKFNIGLIKCKLVNNSCFGFSKNTYMYGRGGAIGCRSGKISIEKCKFENNSLNIFGNGTTVSSHGGSCYLLNVWANIILCDFINNKVLVSELERSYSIAVGGAIYASSHIYQILCRNCTFINNLAIDQSEPRFEFAGAIGVANGEVYNCIFNDNTAYNGCDIYNNQVTGSQLSITNCSFKHKLITNRHINSLMYFFNHLYSIEKVSFMNNKILNYVNAFLFDGKIQPYKGKSNFHLKNNCVSPYNKSFFIRNCSLIKFISFDFSFSSACDENITYEVNNETVTQKISDISKSEEQIITSFPIESKISIDNQQNNSMEETSNKLFKKILILVVVVMLLQIIIILAFIALIIFLCRRKYKQYNNLENNENF